MQKGTSNVRKEYLRKIEIELQKEWKLNKIFESKAVANWDSKLNFEEKN